MYVQSHDQYKIIYDPQHDVLEIKVVGSGQPVNSSEIRPNIFVHKDESNKISGFTIFHFPNSPGMKSSSLKHLPYHKKFVT